MKKIFIIAAACIGFSTVFAQEKASNRKLNDGTMEAELPEGWTKRGTSSLLINQAAFDNWVSGGTNTVGVIFSGDYEANLRKGKNMWDNRLILGYGIKKNKGTIEQKSEDVINLTTKYRHQIDSSHWYFGAAANFKTQFTNGYEYDDLSTGAGERVTSAFFAPAYLTVGAGVDYIPNKNFELNIHPLTSKMTFVTKDEVKVDAAGNPRFGLDDANDSFVYELGLFVGARHHAKLMENITFDHQIGLYSNYLENPDHIDVAYLAKLVMQVNKYVSAQISGELVYDHDQIRRLQAKETIGVGLTYNFGK